MKKLGFLFTCLLTTLFTGTYVSASLYEFYEGFLPSISERVPLAESCGITLPYTGTYEQNIALEDCLNNESVLGASPLPTDNYDSFLTSPLSSSATSVFVNSLPNVSSTIYTIFSSDGITPSEKIYCTGTTSTPSNKLTTCTRGVSFSPVNGVIDETAGTGTSHSKNSRIAITDNINFSGKALNILYGNQITGNTTLDIGVLSTTSIRLYADSDYKYLYSHNGDANEPFLRYSESLGVWQWSENGTDTYNFTSSSVSQLIASSTMATKVVNSEIGVIVSSSKGMYEGVDGNGIYQSVDPSTGVLGEGANGITFSTSTLVDLIATSTPTADKIVMASSTGKIADGWLNLTDTQATDLTDGGLTDSLHQHLYQGIGDATVTKTYWTFSFPFYLAELYTVTAQTNENNGGWIQTAPTSDTANSSITDAALWFNQADNSALNFNTTQGVAVEIGVRFYASTAGEQGGFGLSSLLAPFNDYVDQTADACAFTYSGDTVYAHTSNAGVGHTEEAITGITLTNTLNTYRIEFNPTVNCKFYVNGVLKTTITTNLPDGATPINFGWGSSGTTNNNYINRLTTPFFYVEK